MIKKKILFFIVYLCSNLIYSQVSDLGRFTVNINKGCSPLNVEIIDENVDSSVSVIQYDFNYSPSGNIFNPSSGKSFTYNDEGNFIIAQAINQDGIQKIDILNIEVKKPKPFDVKLFNCLNNNVEIIIEDSYYDGFKLYINNTYFDDLKGGVNKLNYSSLLNSNNVISGRIIGEIGGNDINCSEFKFELSSVFDNNKSFLDSIILSNDRTEYSLYLKYEKSTNYNIIVDGIVDSSFISSSNINNYNSSLLLKNETFYERCLIIEKEYKCDNKLVEDDICLIYMNAYEKDGIKIEFNYSNNFDSIHILRNNLIIKSLYNNEKKSINNTNIIQNQEYCYRIVGFYNNKISKSNIICIKPKNNYNAIPVPNAFTPNNDGLNDVFKPFDSNVSDFRMIILNKLGEQIFETNDINLGWDGYFKGKIIQGSYIYKIELTIDNKNVVQTGKFILIK